MNRLLIIVGGLLVGLLAALFLLPTLVDWNRYRGTFEEEATRLLGREVRVGGQVNLRLLPTPYIRFEKVRIADRIGAVGEPFFRADDVTIWLAVGPLFSGAVEASQIELSRPALTLVLDDKGGGNWRDIAVIEQRPGFVPSRVSLQAVRITNGTIAVYDAMGRRMGGLERFNGELSAGTLAGPYRITGAFARGATPHEIRLSTAPAEADGSVRFKGSVRTPANGGSVSVDGLLRDLLGRPHVEGELTARIPLPPQSAPAPQGAQGQERAFEVKAGLKADTAGMNLTDMAVSFEQDGRPQLAAGAATVHWGEVSDLSLSLGSRWLDLDRIAGAAPSDGPLAIVARLLGAVGDAVPGSGQSRVRLDLDQATLAGEVVSGLGVTVSRRPNGLGLQVEVAQAPGGSRIEADGLLVPGPDPQAGLPRGLPQSPAPGGARFEGRGVLRGANLARFMAWAGRGQILPPAVQDGAFALSSGVVLASDTMRLRGLSLQLAGQTVGGEVSWTGGARPKLALTLEGSELDLTPFLDPAPKGPGSLLHLARRLSAAPAPTGKAVTGAGPDIVARLRIGRLIAGATHLRDVEADLTLEAGNLTLPLLRLGDGEAWQLELHGDIAGLMQPGAKGNVHGLAEARTPAGLTALAAFLELPSLATAPAGMAEAMLPLRLAGRVGVGDKGAEIYDLQLDGQLGASRLAGSMQLEARGAGWREHGVDLALTLEGTSADALLAQLLPQLKVQGPRAVATGRPARVLLRGLGTPGGGLVTLATFDIEGLAAELSGRTRVTDTGSLAVTGDLRLAAADLGRAMAAVRAPRTALDGVAAGGVLAVSGEGWRWSLAAQGLQVGGLRLDGKLDLDATQAGPLRVAGRLSLDTVSLPVLLALLSDGGAPRSTPATPAAAPDATASWPDGTFDFGWLSAIAGKVTLEAGRLELARGIALGRAGLELAASEAGLDVRLLQAKALDGRLVGSLRLERTPAGARLAGSARLTAARLEAFAPKSPAVLGRAELTLTFAGTAQGPRGLIASLAGQGELALDGLRLARLSPAAPKTAAEGVLALRGELPPDAVRRQVEAALAAGGVDIGKRRLPVSLADGVVRLATVSHEGPQGRLSGATSIDLEQLKVDSEWRLEPKRPEPKPGEPKSGEPEPADAAAAAPRLRPIPGFTVVWAGPLAQLASLTPQLQIEAFEREVTLHRYEREVEELERLRREDQERRRQEAERREAERREAERLRQLLLESQRLPAPQGSNVPAGPPPQPLLPGQAPPAPGVGPRTELPPVAAPAPLAVVPAPAAVPADPAAPGGASVPAAAPAEVPPPPKSPPARRVRRETVRDPYSDKP